MSFELVVITSEKDFPKEAEVICNLFTKGLKTLHIRKPNASLNELRDYISNIPKPFHKRIVIHSHYQLAKEFKLKGIHLTEKARKVKFRANDLKIVSASFHSTTDILKSRRKYEYVFLSPVFDSISKQGYTSNFTNDELTLFLKKTKQHVIALGGISDKNIQAVKKLNFSGTAALGYIWESKNPLERYKKLFLKIK